jgi:hypothetical protein
MLKDRIGELKATHDQARLDAERAEDAIKRDHAEGSQDVCRTAASACEPMAAAIAAITFARSPRVL